MTQVLDALKQNNANEGGDYIAHGNKQQLVCDEALISNLEDVETIVVESRAGETPIMIRDLGEVKFAPMIPYEAATRDGRGEIVTATAMLLMGENSRLVAWRVDECIREIEKTLTPGVYIDTFYDRTTLVDRTIARAMRLSYFSYAWQTYSTSKSRCFTCLGSWRSDPVMLIM